LQLTDSEFSQESFMKLRTYSFAVAAATLIAGAAFGQATSNTAPAAVKPAVVETQKSMEMKGRETTAAATEKSATTKQATSDSKKLVKHKKVAATTKAKDSTVAADAAK